MKWPWKASPKAKAERPLPEPHAQGWVSPTGYLLSEQLVAVSLTGAGAASIASLATDIIAQHLSLGRRGLAICGAAQGAGVTFLTANLGMALAQAGVSTLIVDVSFEDPQLQSLFRPPRDHIGLGDLLADPTLTLSQALHRDVVPGLSVLYAGKTDHVMTAGLDSERLGVVTRACLRDFDCTLFDAGPANRSTDALTLSASVGYALLVARRGNSFADDLTFLADQLRQDGVTVIGSVFNGV